MNADQEKVKAVIEPLLNVCDFLNEFLNEREKFIQGSESYKSLPETQQQALADLQKTRTKFNRISEDAKGVEHELLNTPALEIYSLASHYPKFDELVAGLRYELMKLITIQTKL